MFPYTLGLFHVTNRSIVGDTQTFNICNFSTIAIKALVKFWWQSVSYLNSRFATSKFRISASLYADQITCWSCFQNAEMGSSIGHGGTKTFSIFMALLAL